MKRVIVTLLAIAILPVLALGILALLGAHADVGVVTTGTGEHAALGAMWVAAWLASVIVSPIAVVASVVATAIQYWARPNQSCTSRPSAHAS